MTDPLFAPVELIPPDIAPYRRGNTGIDHVTSLSAAEPGPHVVLNALVHGNELCGAIALDALLRMGLRPTRGRLTFVFANTAAYATFDRQNPYASRYLDEDFNRLWSPDQLDGRRDSVELRRARVLRPVYESADLLLDLHSMTADTAPLTLCGRTTRGRDLALGLGYPAWVVADGGHAGGKRLIDYGSFAEPEGSHTAILVECGQHWRTETATVALESCLRLLLGLEMIEPPAHGPKMRPRTDPQRVVEVTEAITAASERFRFTAPFVGMEVIGRAGTVIGWDDGHAIVTPYDDCVLIMPARRVKIGQTAVRLGRIAG
ncbi:succinylglutamate desuccinylase [Azospirillum sp. TSH100]|uniref:succinylglutamate desuccinylase/aspartoacylase domain-containing protein n=1 Tax=Azospirillum sp. TSH100 TaxID=652764 RepID=UPI000D615757|nr:succinylglutamate desuccinylase/aspartoacylase family protein [Azospirillum sp. TSH100]PWC83989.1 succinylglutamate desuccinylase [Azospirillum sp. TSH100]QCG87513.1 succinylglutamate desuccinylase [Azospirillum sp. TSH100]